MVTMVANMLLTECVLIHAIVDILKRATITFKIVTFSHLRYKFVFVPAVLPEQSFNWCIMVPTMSLASTYKDDQQGDAQNQLHLQFSDKKKHSNVR